MEPGQSETVNRRKWAAVKAVVFIALIGIIIYYLPRSEAAINLYTKYFVNDHKLLVSYLDKLDRLNSESDGIINDTRLKLYQIPEASYLAKTAKDKTSLQEVLVEINAISVPKGFTGHKAAFIEVVNQRLVVIANFEKAKKTNQFEELNASTAKLMTLQEQERASLLKAFKAAGIEYKVLGDGTFRYWFKSHSAKEIKHN